ncbi:DNA-binding protein [Gynuella sp.]|uniref:DNA-binding protein n=1 Tax=Gynuella sp. TaxID=2969146 RepID=UPI003D106365
MARGGITKINVMDARTRLLARGERASIDAVRIELGNTGSRSTIHRYLKEIEEGDKQTLRDESFLSDEIKKQVIQLATLLHEEASEVVRQQSDQYESELQLLRESLQASEDQVKTMAAELEQQHHQLEQLQQENTALQQSNQALTVQQELARQQQQHLEQQVSRQQQHIESLEDKHRQARDSLNHYRESVKNHNEQMQREHDRALQQAHAEVRELKQSISVKQDELTRATSEQARLFSQLSESRQQNSRLDQVVSEQRKTYDRQSQHVGQLEQRLSGQDQQLSDLRQKLAQLELLEVQVPTLKAELAVKDALIREYMTAGDGDDPSLQPDSGPVSSSEPED